jgi:hypothetical protein
MVYFVFDMDETLAQFNDLYALMAFISTSVLTKEQFDGVIGDIANSVKDGFDIGIFRPALYKYFAFLHELKENGILHSTAIYSNNGWLYTVSFMVGIVNAWFPGLMCEGLSKQGVHSLGKKPEFRASNVVYAKGYNGRNITNVFGNKKIADYKKQWATVQKIFQNESCGRVEIRPENTFFYDDNLHDERKHGSDMKTILGPNYIQNSAYSNGLNPEFWRILNQSFKRHGIVNEENKFDERIINLFQGYVKEGKTLEEHIAKKRRGIQSADVNESLFVADEQRVFRDGDYSYIGFLSMVKTQKQKGYFPFGTHGSLESAIEEYNTRWIGPILDRLTEEEKAELTTFPLRAAAAGGRRRSVRKTRKHRLRQHKKRTYKKYSRK